MIEEEAQGVYDYLANKREDSNPNTPEQQKMHDMVWQDYQIFKENRQDHEDIWRKEQRFYKGDHWAGLRSEKIAKSRPNSVDNVSWSQIESMVSSVIGGQTDPSFEEQEQNDEEGASMLNEYMPYELRQIKFEQKNIQATRRSLIHGPLIYKTVYDPSVEGGRGNNRFIGQNDIIPLELGSFFPDPRVKDFIYLQRSHALIINTVRDIEYFKERFGEQGEKVEEDNHSGDVEIFDYDKSESTLEGSRKRSNLIEYWYKGKPKMLSDEDKQLFMEMAEEKLSEDKDPSECLAKAEGTAKGVHCIYISSSGVFLEHKAYVYDHGKYPIVARTLFPIEGNPWGKGFMRDMIPPQIMLNKFSELAIETTAKQGNGGIMYQEEAINKSHIPTWKRNRSIPGAMLPVTDLNGVKEFQGIEVPATVLNMMEYYKDMLQKIPGRFDSANGQSNAQVNSGEQAKALIAASQGRLNLPATLIQDALEEVFEQYIELMAQFYSERVGRVTGREVSFDKQKLMAQAETDYEGQQVVEEYVPQFDIKVNIGLEKPKDREYYIQTAFNLLQTPDPMTGMPMIDAEGVKYTLENGRLEPFSVINERLQRDQQIQQQMQQHEQQIEQLTQQIQMMQDDLGQSEQQNVVVEQDKIAQEQDKEQFSRYMQERKMDVDELNALSKSNYSSQT
jgi:hypothetical protein